VFDDNLQALRPGFSICPVTLRARPAQAAAGGTASATFVAPRTPGTYTGSVTSAGGTQPFSITVTGTLPATGTDDNDVLAAAAVGLLVLGTLLLVGSQVRRPARD
jgi:LPXTG-motif cell wall-anchored protein